MKKFSPYFIGIFCGNFIGSRLLRQVIRSNIPRPVTMENNATRF